MMMKNNKMIVYKENVFIRISRFFKKLFHLGKNEEKENTVDENLNELQKETFMNNVVIKEDEEVKNLKELQQKYESGEISEDDLTVEEMDKLIKMYQDETEELNKDTERIKNRIAKMLNY